MAAPFEFESKVTDRGQTTVPANVRRALGLVNGDRIRYAVRTDGQVVLTRVEGAKDADPALGRFLAFLARDIEKHPERLRAVDAGLLERIQALVGDDDIDLNAALSPEDE